MLGRSFEALVVVWNAVAVSPGRAPLRGLRRRIGALCAASVDVAFLGGPSLADVERLLAPGPSGPGRLLLSLNHDSEIHLMDALGTRRQGGELPAAEAAAVAGPSESLNRLLQCLSERGIGAGLTLVVGDDFGPREGQAGRDAPLVASAAARRCTVVSIGPEPEGAPPGICHLPGGPRSLEALLDEQLHRRRRARVPSIDPDPAWVLTVEAKDRQRARVYESLLALADGVVGLRGSHDTPEPHESPLVVAAGVYTGQGPGEHLLEAPWPLALGMTTSADGERRSLDLHTGVLLREGSDGVRTLRLVAAGRRGVVVQRAEGPAGRLHPGSGPFSGISTGSLDGVLWARATGSRGGVCVAASQDVHRDGSLRCVERIAAYATDARRPPPLSRATSRLDQVRRVGVDGVLAEHRAAWAQRWSDACVWIPDDPDAQFAVRFALFQLWNSVSAPGEVAVGARGLTGAGYAGHVFWDTDVFVLPAVASIWPAAAKAILGYRLHRLPQARSIAQLQGHAGARFPWESASDGFDVTPTSGRSNGDWVPIRTGQLEEHIVADVAWAACHYADWSGDQRFLHGPGRSLVIEGARYWTSRVDVDAQGRAHILRVIGPDEYHENVDDNAYTNVLARWNLRRAAALAPRTREAGVWLKVAEALVDGYDRASGRHEQFEGFSRLQPLLVADLGPPPIAADLLLGQARVAASQVVKQPDVLMAHHLLPDEMAAGSLEADLAYYLPRTAHGSSLSPAITASLLARAGRPDEAMELLDVALRLDLDDVTGVTGSGLHLATLAGVWQALLFGFAGARVASGVLRLDPRLPARWGELSLRFRCLGRHVELHIGPSTAQVRTSGPMSVRTSLGDPVRVTRQARLVNTDKGWMVTS